MERETFAIKTQLPDMCKEDPEIMLRTIKMGRRQLCEKLIDNALNNEPVTVVFSSRVHEDFMCPNTQTILTKLEVNPINIKNRVVEPILPILKPRVEHKGFWAKLKLAFSKKAVYTDD